MIVGKAEQSDSDFLRELIEWLECRISRGAVTERLEEIADRLEGRCDTCKWWGERRFGDSECKHPKLSGDYEVLPADGASSFAEGDLVLTGPRFRCIHYEAKGN